MLTSIRALKALTSLSKSTPKVAKPAKKPSFINSASRPSFLQFSVRGCAASIETAPITSPDPSIQTVHAPTASVQSHNSSKIETALQNLLDGVVLELTEVGPDRLKSVSAQIDALLTREARQSLFDAHRQRVTTAQKIVLAIMELKLRIGDIEALDALIKEVGVTGAQKSWLYNIVWAQYVFNDSQRSILNHRAIDSEKFETGKMLYHQPWTIGGTEKAMLNLSESIALALSRHYISISDSTLSALVRLTMRLIRADLKAVRQEVVEKKASESHMQSLKANAEQPAPTHHDLTPSYNSEYLPSLNTIWESAPVLRRPIPINKSHGLARLALGPIWELLKSLSGELSMRNIYTLLAGFKEATLVQPTLFLVQEMAKRFDLRSDPFVLQGYEFALQTLNNDIRYEDVYLIYKRSLLTEEGKSHPMLLRNKNVLASLLEGVSRAPQATLEEKHTLYRQNRNAKSLTPAALTSYSYALSREASVTSSELFQLYMQSMSGAAKSWNKHQLRFMNEIFLGLSLRGSFQLAYTVLETLWQRGGVVSANTLQIFLSRCIFSDQIDLVEKILAIMRPEQTASLYRPDGELSRTTSRQLPILIHLSPDTYRDLFGLYARFNNSASIIRALTDYHSIDKHTQDRQLFRFLLNLSQSVASPSLTNEIIATFDSLGFKMTILEANYLLMAYNKAGEPQKTIDAFESLKSLHHLVPDELSYCQLAYAYSIQFDLDRVIGVLDQLKAAGIRATSAIYSVLVRIASRASLERAEWLLQHMLDQDISPTSDTYEPLLKAYAEDRNLAMFEAHLDRVVAARLLSPSIASTVITGMASIGDVDRLINWILPLLKREGVEFDFKLIGQLVLTYCRLDHDDLAHAAILELPQRRALQTQSKLTNLVFLPALTHLATKSLDRTWAMIHRMETIYGVPVGLQVYRAILRAVENGASSDQKTQALEWVSKHLHPKEFEALSVMSRQMTGLPPEQTGT